MGSLDARPRRLGALLVAAALLLAGCGGSERDEAEAPSKQQYIAQGDAICADIQADAARLRQRAAELQAQSGELPKTEFLAQAAAFWQDQIRVAEDFLQRFEDLGSPSGDEAEVEEFRRNMEDGIATAREIRETLAGGEEVSEALVQEYGQIVARGNESARDYGFQVCGQTQASEERA